MFGFLPTTCVHQFLDSWIIVQARGTLAFKLVMLSKLVTSGVGVLGVVHLAITLGDLLARHDVPVGNTHHLLT